MTLSTCVANIRASTVIGDKNLPGWRTFVEDDETKRRIREALQEVRTRPLESSPVSEGEIASTKGDKQLLRLLERCCQDGGGFDLPFPRKFDSIFEKLSFTAKSFTPDQRRTAWSDFETEHGVAFEWEEKQGIALWYRDHDVLDHAAAVYEDLHREARANSEIDKSYLLEAMEVHTQLGEYKRVRELFVHVKEAYEEKEVDNEFYKAGLGYVAEIAGSFSGTEDDVGNRNILLTYVHELENDLENERFENSRLKLGVLFKEERQAATEWLNQNLGQVVTVLSADAKDYLIEAVLYSRSTTLQIESGENIPKYFGQAVEAEFNAKVWDIVKEKLDEALKKRFPFIRFDLSINNIYRILADTGSGAMSEVRLASRPHIIELLGQDTVSNLESEKLRSFMTDSSDTRHGSRGRRKYTITRLNQFLDDMGVSKQNGWIYGFLKQLQPSRPKAK